MNPPKRICVFLAGALGDFILALPAIYQLRHAFPSSQVELVGTASWLPLAMASQGVDKAYSMEDIPAYAAFQPALSSNHPLSRFLARYDLIVSWFGDRHGHWERTLRQACPGQVLVSPLHRYESFEGHLSDYYLSSLRHLGLPSPEGPGRVLWPPAVTAASSSTGILQGERRHSPGTYLCLHPGSGSGAKNWPREDYGEVVRRFRDQRDMAVVVLLGPAEYDQRDFWRKTENDWLSIGIDLPLLETFRLLSGAALYLGNDSGITHLAASLGVPTVAVFGPTDPNRWAPLGPHVKVVKKEDRSGGHPASSPSGSYPDDPHFGISVQEVLLALLQHLPEG